MEKLQLITYNPLTFNDNYSNIDIKDFNKLKSLDNYNINIFDLSSKDIWKSEEKQQRLPSSNCTMTSDFKSINKMITNSKNAINLICLPQNLNYFWKCYSDNYSSQLKDILPVFIQILKQIIPIEKLDIIYENNSTLINSNKVNSSFYINNSEYDVLTTSDDSNKTTSVKIGNIIITCLDIIKNDNSCVLMDYLKELGLIKNEIEYPDWIHKYDFNDDKIQNNNIEQAKSQIKLQKEIIENANQKIKENLHYKSILYNNSDQLVEVVFEILEYIFDISLSDFNDEKKEDFLFKKSEVTFIGEIKGVTSNVKYENISQLEVHYSKYLDKLQEENRTEKIKKILIMNYERTKDIAIRDEINQMQIDLAKKNNTLIIDSKSLLIIYESVLQGKFSKSKIINYIIKNSGKIDVNKIM